MKKHKMKDTKKRRKTTAEKTAERFSPPTSHMGFGVPAPWGRPQVIYPEKVARTVRSSPRLF